MKLLKYSPYLFLFLLITPCLGQFEEEEEQETGPNLVFMPGMTFDMGYGTYNVRRVTVASFYIDATEVWNQHYREFVGWMQKHEPNIALAMILPDTTVWKRYIEGEVGSKLSKDYFRNTAFDYHPVVGVNWEQAQMFSRWRTDRVNQAILEKKNLWTEVLKKKNPAFYSDLYLAGEYGAVENSSFNILLPNYRLASEGEWEMAGWGFPNSMTQSADKKTDYYKNYYQPALKNKKHFDKSIKKFRKTVEKHAKKNPVPSYYDKEKLSLPGTIFEGDLNRVGLYNMNDNVSEWVQDSYNPRTSPLDDLNPISDTTTGYTADCPPTKLHHTASIKKGALSQFYTSTASFFGPDGIEISFQEFYQLKLNPSSPYQVIETDDKDDIHIKTLSKSSFEIIQGESATAANSAFFDIINPKKVSKGANSGDEKMLKGPGYTYPLREFGSFDLPIGFRCAMTRVGKPRTSKKKKK
jgi:sulfatase modifying factor 1